MDRIDRVIDRVVGILGDFCGWLTIGVVLLVFVEVISRYVAHRPFMLADEFSGYALVALSFIGAAFAWRDGSHVRITLLTDRLSGNMARWFRLISLLIVMLFVLAMTYASFEFLETSFKFRMASSSWLRFPLQVPHLTLLIGFLFLLIVVTVDFAKIIVNIKRKKDDGEMVR